MNNLLLVLLSILLSSSVIETRTFDFYDEELDYIHVYDKRAIPTAADVKTEQHDRLRRSDKGNLNYHLDKNDGVKVIERSNVEFNKTEHVFEGDSNNIAFVFWKSSLTNVIFILTCNIANATTHSKLMNKGCHSTSNFYRSEDLGGSYKTRDGKGSLFEKKQLHSIYLSPLNTSFIIITDYQNQEMFITNDEGNQFMKFSPGFAPTFVLFHPKEFRTIAAFDNFKKSLWMSLDGGKEWILVRKGVRNYFWDEQNINSLYVESDLSVTDSQLSHAFVSQETSNIDRKKRLRLVITSMQKNLVKDSVYVGGFFVLLQKSSDQKIYVANFKKQQIHSQVFKKAKFNRYTKPHNHQIVLSSDNDELVLAFLHSKTATLFLSDATGQSFRFLVDDVIIKTFDVQSKSKRPKIDYHRAKGTKNTYIINRQGNSTLISFNKGHTWKELSFNSSDIYGKDLTKVCKRQNTKCGLNLFIEIDSGEFTAKLISKESAPGIIMAQGIMLTQKSQELTKDHFVWLSVDGGRNWRMTLERNYGYAILDHGNFLAATALTYTINHEVYFSDNFGNTWFTSNFTRLHSRIAAIITDSTAKTLAVNIFGFLEKQREGNQLVGDTWIVWRFDFTKLFTRTCEDKDLFDYQPPGAKCILGENLYYHRVSRFQNLSAVCYTQPNDVRNRFKSKPCKCEKNRDFKCNDFHYSTSQNDLTCISFNKTYTENVGVCNKSGYRTIPSAYLRLNGNKCEGGNDMKLLFGKLKKCHATSPSLIKIRSSAEMNSVGKTVYFEMEKHPGNFQTNYTWLFGDGTSLSGSYEEMEKVEHVYYAPDRYNVSLIAVNEIGSYTARLKIMVIDISHLNVFIVYDEPAIVGRPTKFRLIRILENGDQVTYNGEKGKLFLWSFKGLYQTGSKGTSIEHNFHAVGVYIVEVQIVSPLESKIIHRTVHVYQNAAVIEFSFNNLVDISNTGTKLWMNNFQEKIKVFLTQTFLIYGNRIRMKDVPGLPTKVNAIICDIDENSVNNQQSAQEISKRIVKYINTKKPLIYHFDVRNARFESAQITSYIKSDNDKMDGNIKISKTKGKPKKKTWIFVVVLFLVITLVVVGGFIYYMYRRRRMCFFTVYVKGDTMQKELVYDVDEDCVGFEESNIPHYRE